MSWAFVSSLPLACLFPCHQHTQCHIPPQFYPWPVAGIQNSQVLKGLANCGPTPLPWRGASQHAHSHPVPEKQLHREWAEARVYCIAQPKAGTKLISCLHLTQSPTLFCPRKAVTQRLESIVADKEKWQPGYLQSAGVSALCLVLQQKSSCSAHTQGFKPIVAYSEKLLRFSALCTHLWPCCWGLLNGSQLAFCPWRGKIRSSKCTLGGGGISFSATQGISSP